MTITTQLTPKVLRAKDAASFIGIGVSTFWRWVKDGKIPEGTKLSTRCTVWHVRDLETYLDTQKEAKHV